MDQDEFLQELKAVFIAEAGDTMDTIESSFLQLENNKSDFDLIHSIFRSFHNLKGSGKTVGFQGFSKFAHSAENLLAKIRDDKITISDEIMECLLGSSDLMRDYLEAAAEGTADDQPLTAQSAIIDGLLAKIASGPSAEENSADSSAPETVDESNADIAGNSAASGTEVKKEADKSTSASPFGDGGFGFFEENMTPAAPVPAAAESTATVAAASPATAPSEVTAPAADPSKKTDANKDGAQAAAKPAATPPAASGNKQSLKAEEAIRVPISKISQILDLFGEQVIMQSGLDHFFDQENCDIAQLSKSIGQLKKITQTLQQTMMTLRMVKLQNLFNKLERSVRDVAKLTGKKISLEKIGSDAELDKNIVDALGDPLNHMIRNAADHGIESPDERLTAGKDESGHITISARRSGGSFEIIIKDDGKGLDKEAIFAKGVKNGLISPDAKMSDQEIYQLIFNSGFSTREQATEISGRGVGMDVVKQQLLMLKGGCEIRSEKGAGSEFIIRVPLSLAMFNGTVIRINNERYVVPNSDYTEVIMIPKNIVDHHHDDEPVRVGERVVKLVDLRKKLKTGRKVVTDINDKNTDILLAIVCHIDGKGYALLIDQILSQEQIVLKELGPEAKKIYGTSGGTILGDGRVALVLDVQWILRQEIKHFKRLAS